MRNAVTEYRASDPANQCTVCPGQTPPVTSESYDRDCQLGLPGRRRPGTPASVTQRRAASRSPLTRIPSSDNSDLKSGERARPCSLAGMAWFAAADASLAGDDELLARCALSQSPSAQPINYDGRDCGCVKATAIKPFGVWTFRWKNLGLRVPAAGNGAAEYGLRFA